MCVMFKARTHVSNTSDGCVYKCLQVFTSGLGMLSITQIVYGLQVIFYSCFQHIPTVGLLGTA